MLQDSFENVKDQEARNHLGALGVKGDLALQRIGSLSGGQKSRVAFALLTYRRPHLIIMDEPTNHLDLDTIEALLDALSRFVGGIILVSHDQYFLEKAVDEYWGINGEGAMKVFHEDFDGAVAFSYKMPEPDDDKDKKKKKKKEKEDGRDREGGREKHQGVPKVPKLKKVHEAAAAAAAPAAKPAKAAKQDDSDEEKEKPKPKPKKEKEKEGGGKKEKPDKKKAEGKKKAR